MRFPEAGALSSADSQTGVAFKRFVLVPSAKTEAVKGTHTSSRSQTPRDREILKVESRRRRRRRLLFGCLQSGSPWRRANGPSGCSLGKYYVNDMRDGVVMWCVCLACNGWICGAFRKNNGSHFMVESLRGGPLSMSCCISLGLLGIFFKMLRFVFFSSTCHNLRSMYVLYN